jgi:bacteriocin biosynthesis cyclodehydratase domain-containing protein
MEKALPGGKEASYRLLGLQALVHDGGVILKRGTTRLFLDGRDVAEIVDFLVERLAGGRAVELGRLKAEINAERRDALVALVDTLKAHRFLIDAEEGETAGRNREEVFFWNYRTNFAAIVGELAEIRLTVFGVNSIGLALLGNLRSCGFRDIVFVDHPALRNLDYFDAKRKLRHEISGALSVAPRPFESWSVENPKPEGCFVVCCDFGGRPLMRDWNRFCVEHRVLFYPIVLLDHVAHLGPMVVPGEGPCYECLWARQNANLTDAARFRAGEMEADVGQHAIGYLQPMARAAADFAALDLLKILSTPLPGGRIGSIVEIDLMGPAATTRDLLRVPRCPVCSEVVAEPAESGDEAGSEAATAPAEPPPKNEAAKDEPAKEEKSEPLPATATESAA